MRQQKTVSPDPIEMATEAVRRLVAAIVDDPEQFPVTSLVEGDVVFIHIRKGPRGDGGQVIGKGGRNIQALRTLAQALFSAIKTRVYLELVDFD